MNRTLRLCSIALLLGIVGSHAMFAQANALSEEEKNAAALFQAGDWKAAADAYSAITRSDPKNGRAWFRLGMSLHSMADYPRAAEALKKSAEIGGNPVAMYNLACAYARSGDADNAIDWLGKAIAAGTFTPEQIRADADFESLKSDARMPELLAQAEKKAHPCRNTPEYRQLDFWVGEWNVTVAGQQAGTSSIQRILDDCVILENWTGVGGLSGKSFNVYNAATGKWQQTWVDDKGSVLELHGNFRDGALRYEGTTTPKGGAAVMHRLSFTPLDGGRVRQLWEQSTDGGATWGVAFDGVYNPSGQ